MTYVCEFYFLKSNEVSFLKNYTVIIDAYGIIIIKDKLIFYLNEKRESIIF